MLLFSDMLVRYASPSGPMCLRCPMLNFSGPVELLFLLCFIATWTCCGECYVGRPQPECVPIHASGCFVCFMFDCVGELFFVNVHNHRRHVVKPYFPIVPRIVFLHH